MPLLNVDLKTARRVSKRAAPPWAKIIVMRRSGFVMRVSFSHLTYNWSMKPSKAIISVLWFGYARHSSNLTSKVQMMWVNHIQNCLGIYGNLPFLKLDLLVKAEHEEIRGTCRKWLNFNLNMKLERCLPEEKKLALTDRLIFQQTSQRSRQQEFKLQVRLWELEVDLLAGQLLVDGRKRVQLKKNIRRLISASFKPLLQQCELHLVKSPFSRNSAIEAST